MEYNEYNEVLMLLDKVPSMDYYKIPSEIINGIKSKAIKDVKVSEDLSEDKVSKNAYTIFVKLYQDYIATDEEKESLDEKLNLNDKKKRKEFEIKFDNKENSSKIINENNNKIEVSKNENLLKKENKSFIEKIILKIKKIFKK